MHQFREHLLKVKGISIAEAARQMKYSREYVSRVLSGHLRVTCGFRARSLVTFGPDVAVFFECDVSDRLTQQKGM